MKHRLFKPGDRVELRSGGPVMIVQKYVREHKPWIGWVTSDTAVECSWYDKNEGYQTGIFHQNSLTRSSIKSFTPHQGYKRNLFGVRN